MNKFSCDIDGILNDYPQCWLIYLAERCGTLYETVKLAKEGEPDYRKYKDEYRNSSYKANLPIHRANRDIINTIISTGLEPVMVTSRPIHDAKYPCLYDNTYNWLKKNGVKFEQFDYKDPAAAFLDKYGEIKFHIDDDPVYAIKVASKGVKVYLIHNDNWDFSVIQGHPNVTIIKDLKEIFKYE